MFRFISFLLGKQYEECKGCETLKQQLYFVNEEKKQLIQTLVDIVKPKPPAPQEIISGQQIPLSAVSTFSRRRSMLEQKDRQQAKTLKESQFVAKPDNPDDKTIDNVVEKLEEELKLNESATEGEVI